MDNVIDVIKNRRSIRKYVNRPLLKSEIEQIIDAGRYAPSAHNAQPWKFIVITDKAKINYLSEEIKGWFRIRARLAKIVRVFNAKVSRELETAEKRIVEEDLFFYNAPVLVLICAKPGRFSLVDCACAGQNMMLVARSLGIGSCWIGYADLVINKKRNVMRELGVPEDHKVMGHLIFGYPIKFPEKALPRKMEEIKWI
ncbi:MAG TPA: nitroreductase family protein [Candidatus Nanoarchaeia archaeon]|nr:nitroreductase family protein [Candidatus Nanoarchaeia archaeon]